MQSIIEYARCLPWRIVPGFSVALTDDRRTRMLFNSVDYLIFFPVVTIVFYCVPKKLRHFWLLIASYYFYMCWNPKYALLIAASTVITYLSGIGMAYVKGNPLKKIKVATACKGIVAVSFLINLGILVVFKYAEWILDNINVLFHVGIGESFSLVLPVGISFYTFQALSYTMDVYRGEIKAERNFIRYALFVSFFPQLVAGPIERSKNLLPQINAVQDIKFKSDNVRSGLCLILYGLFLKIVVADRLAIFVDAVFDNFTSYGFIELAVAAVLFAFQILCDFNGYSTIARGSAEVLGISLMENFKQPYLATSIKDFWRRWHVSLTTWFTDYLYIPLGGNRKGIVRKMLNTFIVFFTSGLWHGASWHYVAWGLLHGVYQNIGSLWGELKRRFKIKTSETSTLGGNIARVVFTFVITDVAWVFFRASSCKNALKYFWYMTKSVQTTSLLKLGFTWYDWLIAIVSIIIVFIVDILHERGVSIRKELFKERIWFRWLIYLGAFWVVLLFGIYGAGYDASQFIYFQF